MSYFKEENDFGTLIILLNKVAKAFVEDDLFLPLWDDGFVLLEIKRLRHDREDVVNVLLLII